MQRTKFILAYFIFLPIIIGTIGSADCFAQQYPFVHYTPKDGLVNSRVRKAFQDSKGRMYFLTFGGLSVYDGARFRNYTTQNGLASSLVNDILEAGNDSILIAANSEDFLNVLVNGKMEKLNTGSGRIPVINQFYRHENGKIYLSSDHGLYLLDNFRIRELNRSILYNLRTITGMGNWLVLSSNEMKFPQGLYLYNISKNKVVDSLSQNIYLIGKDYNNRIWISSGAQLHILDNDALNNGILSVTDPPGPYYQSKDYSTANLAFDNNSIWFVFRNKEFRNTEIHRIEDNGGFSSFPLPEKATSSVISGFFIDREKTLWLCNEGEGVFKIVNSSLRIIESPFGKSVKVYIAETCYAEKITWYSTNVNKLFRKSSSGLEEFQSNLAAAPAVFNITKKKLLAFTGNIVYEGTVNSLNKTIYFRQLIKLENTDFFGKILLLDPNQHIIAIQQSGLTVWKKNKQVFHLPMAKSDLIDGLFFDDNNLLWAVKRYTGIDVFRLHPDNDSGYLQKVFQFSKEQVVGSPRCAVLDKSGLIWIGTRDHGVICYRQEGNQLIKLSALNTGNGLSDNFVTALACDSQNNIIAGTQTGLDRILRNHDLIKGIENLSKSSNFYSLISQIWADENMVYARSFSGNLLQLFPPEEKELQATPQLLLEEIKVNSHSVSAVKKHFRWKENNISFSLSAPSFIDEKQVSFSYILEGSGNTHWSDTSSANTVINLTNLSASEYILKVKAFFPSATYAPADYSFSFIIAPPWWQTWWFRIPAGILIAGLLIFGLRFYYRRKLERQMALMEKQQAIEKERTRIATDMHDDLGAGLSRIKFLSETIGIKKQRQQPIEEDISKIREYSHQMIDKMGEIVWALNEKNDSLSDLLSYTRSYTVEYLSQNGIESHVEIPENIQAVFVSGEFRRNIYLTIKEALHNIVKHAQANHVNMQIRTGQKLIITIQDDGLGFDENNVRPYSNGISNMRTRMKDIGGEIQILNKKGTCLELAAPLSL